MKYGSKFKAVLLYWTEGVGARTRTAAKARQWVPGEVFCDGILPVANVSFTSYKIFLAWRVGNPLACKTTLQCGLPTCSGVCQLITTAALRGGAGRPGPGPSEPPEPAPTSSWRSCSCEGRQPAMYGCLARPWIAYLQASKGNSCNSGDIWRHLRPQVSHLKVLPWGPTAYPSRLCALTPSTPLRESAVQYFWKGWYTHSGVFQG